MDPQDPSPSLSQSMCVMSDILLIFSLFPQSPGFYFSLTCILALNMMGPQTVGKMFSHLPPGLQSQLLVPFKTSQTASMVGLFLAYLT